MIATTDHQLVFLLLLSVLFVVGLYHFFLRRTRDRTYRAPHNGKVLISVRIKAASMQGVEDRETFVCPFAARRRLEEITTTTGKRCVLERDHSTWTLYMGSSLTVDVDEEHGDTVVHYFLDGAPLQVDHKKGGESGMNKKTQSLSRTTDRLTSPASR